MLLIVNCVTYMMYVLKIYVSYYSLHIHNDFFSGKKLFIMEKLNIYYSRESSIMKPHIFITPPKKL